ncbi:MAG: PD40 domain-containing protein [Burkholderiales bacterium]|nr:PD40 domain-containing protein [Burkholderiales bacterium]
MGIFLAACGGGGGEAADPVPTHDLVFDAIGADGEPRLHRYDLLRDRSSPLAGGVRGIRPVAHPDGTALFYAASDPLDAQSPSLLHWLDLADPRPRRLSVDGAAVETEPSVAPDGRRVAYTSQREDPGGDIVLARWADGALHDRRILTPAPGDLIDPDRTPAWSPDGTRLAFTAYRQGGPAIWVMAADGSQARRITTPGNWGDFSPSWSADGRMIAFQRSDAGADGTLRSRIGLVDAAGGEPRFLPLPHNAYDPRFSPDGRLLAYWARTDDGGDIFLATPEGVVLRRIGTPQVDRHPAWVRRR